VEQRIQLACPVKAGQIVKATDVKIVDKNLRYGTAARARHHDFALRGIKIDTDLVIYGGAFARQ